MLAFDPTQIPGQACDEGLDPLPATQLASAALRQRFANPVPWQPLALHDRRLPASTSVLRPAAVLLGLLERQGDLHVVLTRRAAHLRSHAGQISFPGGRMEPTDVDAPAAALREAEEEIGLSRTAAEVLGQLNDYVTVSAYQVAPVVALIHEAPLAWQTDPGEVDAVFEVPLAHLLNPRHHRCHEWQQDGEPRRFWSIEWQPPEDAPPLFVWGATAAMLRNLYAFLRV